MRDSAQGRGSGRLSLLGGLGDGIARFVFETPFPVCWPGKTTGSKHGGVGLCAPLFRALTGALRWLHWHQAWDGVALVRGRLVVPCGRVSCVNTHEQCICIGKLVLLCIKDEQITRGTLENIRSANSFRFRSNETRPTQRTLDVLYGNHQEQTMPLPAWRNTQK